MTATLEPTVETPIDTSDLRMRKFEMDFESFIAVKISHLAKPPTFMYTPNITFYSPPSHPAQPIRIRPDRKEEWCAALESGKFEQIFNAYAYPGTRYRCAMGVLATLCGAIIPAPRRLAYEWLGVSPTDFEIIRQHVIGWNDIDRLSFEEIAQRIRKEW